MATNKKQTPEPEPEKKKGPILGLKKPDKITHCVHCGRPLYQENGEPFVKPV